MRDSAGVAFRFVRRTPPGVVSSRSSSPSNAGAVLDTAESPTAAESTPPLSRTPFWRNGREVMEVDAVAAELLLDPSAFVAGVNMRRLAKRRAQSKKRFDSMFNVQAYSVGFLAAHQAGIPHLAEAARTRAAGEISIHALLLSV